MPVFPERGFTSRKGTVCGYFQAAYISLRRVWNSFYTQLQPAEILRRLRQTDSPKAENRKRTQAEKWNVRHQKSLMNQGLQPPIWGNAYQIPCSLKIGGQTVHKQKRKECTYEKKISNRGRRNSAGHTDEQDHVHCRRADPARGERPERSRKNRQKLADAVARLAGIAGASRLGNPDHALRCAVSLFGGYTKTN